MAATDKLWVDDNREATVGNLLVLSRMFSDDLEEAVTEGVAQFNEELKAVKGIDTDY